MFNKKHLPVLLCFIFAFMLCITSPNLVFAASTWNGTSSSTTWSGSGNSGDPYIISTADQLKGLADSVNNGTSYSGDYFKLGDDINLGNYAWTPIGGACSILNGVPTGKYFAGVFDGNNKTISGINISNPAASTGAYGLFGYVNGGVIGNLKVAGSLNMGTSAINEIGAVVGYTNGSIYNCHSAMNVCVNNASASQAGGIAGVVENTNTSKILNVQYCSNTGTVTGRGRVGGIVGAVYCVSNGGVVVDECYNTGNLTTVGTSTKSYVGGIVGYCRGYITSCYNQGNLSTYGGHYQGGIVGILQGSNPTARMSYCYNTGIFSGASTSYDQALWASADRSFSVTITDCIYSDKVTTDSNVRITQSADRTWGNCHGVINLADTDMQGEKALESLNATANGTKYGFAQSGGYPILVWQSNPDWIVNDLGSSTTPTASGTDTDEAGAVFLDGTAQTNGNGTKSSPYNNFADAEKAVATASNKTIYITGQVTVSDSQTWSLSGAEIKRSYTYNGYLVNVADGDSLTLKDITIDGNNYNAKTNPKGLTISNGSLINVTGGTLNVGTGAILQNNYGNSGGAIRISGGNTTMTGGTINGNTAASNGAGVAVYGGTFTITPSKATDAFNLVDSIYLGTGQKLSVGATLENITGTLNVQAADPASGRVIAQVAGAYPKLTDEDLGEVVYSGKTLVLNGNSNQIQIQ
ncbi:hypothetical protein CLRAG_34170 [Clostridium ragsdalei P11]|uniref:The GLUG motif protein n=1 Tax=Clostridium ragsdalei P11 TaxID=1353534 RepID=A0A1A6AL14_9CLOT|nr:hypothetical protein [Clostridium ragsdalei]OBR90769.1 hypothetical protein CLRAG_34170 [Clostridium ragsdalei P11]